MGFATLLLVTSFIVGSIAGPLTLTSETECSTTCDGATKKFDYEVGTTYEYDYEAETVTSLRTDGQDSSILRIRATAQVTPITKCDFDLRLRNVRLDSPRPVGASEPDVPVPGEEDFRTALERSPLKFSYADGRVEHLCPTEQEPIWVLNIKRGVLSMFQNAMSDFEQDLTITETDVTGQCLTKYTVERGGWLSGEISVHKTKDLTDCSRRTDHYTSLQFNPYHPQIARKSEALVKSTHQCDQLIKNGHLIKSVCAESHAFQPFSNEKTGAVTNGTQKLNFIRSEKSKIKTRAFVQSRVLLSFDHKYKEFGQNSGPEQAEEALRDLCRASQDEIRMEVPRLFSRLVHRLQELKMKQLHSIYLNVNNICPTNTKAKKLFFDAIPLTGSEAGVELMRDLILRQEISTSEVDTWMLMLGFFPRPTKQMISSLMPLLDQSVVRPKTLLGISTLTHSYCKTNVDCQQDPEIKNLVKHLSTSLGEKCASIGEQEKEKIAVTLKALGNIGYIKDALPILTKCYKAIENPIEIRLAAIDALRRLPCSIDKDELLSTFLSLEEDSEVRIAAYLSIMKCPTPEIMIEIHRSLETEVVNQVGSFVWTHLTSVQETTDPCKRDIKKILSSKKLQKKFSTDVRKFSRYYEGSLYLDSLNTGGHVDGTVVFSPKSYLPRSSFLGLTLDIFGESINLFEIGGRAEGFEYLVESFFGPKGYFPDDTIQKILESARDKQSYDESKLNEIARIFNVKHSSEQEPRGSFYMRVFGNDLLYTQFANYEQLVQRANPIDAMGTLMRLLQNEDAEYTKSFVMMDSSLIVPTGAGLPLNLTLNSTATVNLRVGGKLDLTRMRSNSFDVRAHLQPSASVEISSSMVVDAFVFQSGLKMVATAHTSVQADGELTVTGGELIKARINMPKERMDIFDIESRVYLLNSEGQRPLANLVKEQNHMISCSGTSVSKYMGLQMCAEMEFPGTGDDAEQRPAFLFSGPVAARAYLLKTDKTMESYNFEYRWDKRSITSKTGLTQYIRTGLLLLDTPKSTINRLIKAEFNYNEPEKTISLEFVSPIQQLSLKGQINNDPELKKLELTMTSNQQEQLNLRSELIITRNRLQPSLSLRLLGESVVDMSALIVQQDDGKCIANMDLVYRSYQPIAVSGSFGKSVIGNHKRYDVDFSVTSEKLNTNSKWFLQTGTSIMTTKATIEYQLHEHAKQHATFSSKCQCESSGDIKMTADFENSIAPTVNWDATIHMRKTGGSTTEASLALNRGAPSNNVKFLHIQYERQWVSQWPEHNLTSMLRVQFPLATIDASMELKSKLAGNNLDTSLQLRYQPDRDLSVVVGIERGANPTELIRGIVKLASSSSPHHNIELSGNLARLQPKELMATATCRWGEDTEAKAAVMLRKTTDTLLGHEIHAELLLPGQKPILLMGDVVMDNLKSRVHGETHLNGAIYSTFAEYHQPSIENVRVVVGTLSPYNTYNADVEFQNSKNDKYLTTNFEIGNNHKVTTDIRIKRFNNRATASAELKMDATRHPEQKYDIQLDFHKPISGSEGVVTLHCPTRTVGAKWNFNNDVGASQSPSIAHSGHYEVWWDVDSRITADIDFQALTRRSSRDISGTINIITPFYGMREVVVKMAHNDDGARFTNNGSVQWNGATALSVTSEGQFQISSDTRDVKATIKLETPFTIPKELTIHLDHQLTGRQMQNNVELQWAPESQFKFNLQTSDESGPSSDISYTGALNVTSSFSWFKDIYIAGKISNKDKMVVQMEVDYEQTHLLLDLEGSMLVKDNKIDTYFGIHLVTPFTHYENLSSSLKLKKDISSLTAAVDFTWLKDKRIALEVTAAHQSPSPAQRNAVLSVHLLSPFEYFEDVLLTITNIQQQNQLRYELEAKWAPESTFATQLDYNVNLPQNAYIKVAIQEPFKLFDQFTTELQYSLTEQKLNVDIMGALQEYIIKATTSIIKAESTDDSSHTYHCIVDVNTPFAAFRSFLLKLDHKCQPTIYKHATNMFVTVNGIETTLTHTIRAAAVYDFEHQLQINLPLAQAPLIKLSNMQIRDGNNYKHKSEFSWHPEQRYSIETNTKLQMQPRNYFVDSDVTVNAPAGQYGPFKALLSHETTSNEENKSHFMIEYWPGQIADLSSDVKITPKEGNFHFIIQMPFLNAKPIAFDGNYQFGEYTKHGLVSATWQENKKTSLEIDIKTSNDEFQSDITIMTPWQKYERNNLKIKVNGDDNNKSGNVYFTMGDRKIEASLEGKKTDGKGEYIFTITSPFRGFETTCIGSKYVTSPLDNSVSITAESSLGKFEINVFHNIQSNSMDSGATFKSPIAGIEHITIGTHFDNSTVGKQAMVSIENGNFKANITAKYGETTEGGFLSIDLHTPIIEFNAVKFDGKYTLADKKASLNIFASQNSKHIEFQAIMSADKPKSQATITLSTPFYGYEKLIFDGMLDIGATHNSIVVSVNKNDHKATLSSKIANTATAKTLALQFNSPIDGFKSLGLDVNYKQDVDGIESNIVAEKEGKSFDMSTKFSFNPNVGKLLMTVKTPIEGNLFTSFAINYDVLSSNKQMKLSIQKDDMKAAIETELQMTDKNVEATVMATSSFSGYENVMFALKTNVEDGKHIYTITSQNGISKYQLTWELTSTQGHLASNVILKTPEEDMMLYTQYNFNGANSINFDAKLMKSKTMMELSGRLWKQPGSRRADASILFNSNYIQMTAMSISAHYDITGDKNEFKFQTEYNGQRNEINGLFTRLSDAYNVQISGSTVHPDWKSFSVNGNVKSKPGKSEKFMKLIIKKNDKDITITGSMVDQASIQLTTSVSGYESLTLAMTFEKIGYKFRIGVLLSKGDSNLINLMVTGNKSNAKIIFNIDLASELTSFKTFTLASVFHSGNVIADITSRIDKMNTKITLTGHANVNRGDINLLVDSNSVLPYVQAKKGSLSFKYDSGERYIDAAIKLDDEISKLNIKIQQHSAELLIESPVTKNLKISSQYEMSQTKKEIEFSTVYDSKTLVLLKLEITPNLGNIQAELNYLESPIKLTAQYSVENKRVNLSMRFQISGAVTEIIGHSNYAKQDKYETFETEFTMTSHFKGLEDIQFHALLKPSGKNFVTTLKWASDKEIKFIFDILHGFTGISTVLTTPFNNYEKTSFMYNYKFDNTVYTVSMATEWTTKRIAMEALLAQDKMTLSLSSPFDGIEDVTASYSYGMDPMTASLNFQLNPNFKVEIEANANLRPQIGQWTFAIKLPILNQGNFIFQGQYDFTSHHLAHILAQGNGQKFEMKMQCTESSTSSRQLLISVLTPMEHFQHLIVKANYATAESQTGADISIQFNNREYKASGTTISNEKSMSANAQIVTPISGYENLNVEAKTTLVGKQKSADLNVQVEGKSVMSISGKAKINFPDSLDIDINLINAESNSIGFNVQFDRLTQGEAKLKANLFWNPINKIEIEGVLTSKFGDLKLVTPFSIIKIVQISSKLNTDPKNYAMQSTLNINSNEFKFNFALKDRQPRHLEFNVDIETPCRHLPKLSTKLSYRNNEGRLINSKMTLEIPSASIPQMEIQFDLLNNNFEKVNATVQLRLAEQLYSIEGTLDNDKTGNADTVITIRTPHEKYSAIKLVVNTHHLGLTKNEATLALSLPTSRHTMSATMMFSPEDMSLNVLVHSDCLESTPASFGASFMRDTDSTKLIISADTKQTKRSLNWHLDKSSTTHKGQITYLSTVIATSKDYKWSVNYMSNVHRLKSKDTPITLYLNVNHEAAIPLYDFETLTISLEHSAAHNMNAKVTTRYAQQDHYFVTSYSIQGSTIDSSVELFSPRLPFKIASLKVKLTNKDALLKFMFDKSTNAFSANYKAAKEGYEATFKVEAPTLGIHEFIGTGKLALTKNTIDGSINIQAKRVIHSFTLSLKRHLKEVTMQMKLKTPWYKINNFALNGRILILNPSNVDATFSVTMRRVVHSLALSYKLNTNKLEGYFKLQSPLIDIREITIHVQLTSDEPLKKNGFITITTANSEHSGKFNLACEHQETTGTLEIKSPLLSSNSILLKSSLVKKVAGEVTASVAATLPTGTHSVNCKLHNKDNTDQQIELNLDTALLPAGPYSVIIKFDQQPEKKGILLTLVTPRDVHSVQYNAQKTNEGLTLQGTLKTPLFNIDRVTLTANIYKVSLQNFKIGLALQTPKHNHESEVAVQLQDKKVEFQVKLDTTFFEIGTISSSGMVNIINKQHAIIDMIVATPKYTHKVKGDFQIESSGLIGTIHVDSPFWDTFDIQANVQKVSAGRIQILLSAKSATGDSHKLQADLKQGSGSLDTDVKIDSPMLPCKQFQLSANITLQTPLRFNGDFAIRTPGQLVKVVSNYHNNPLNSVEAGVTLETSFQALPMLKMNGRMARPHKSSGFDGAFELHTDNYGDPKVALYYKYEMENNRLIGVSVTIHTPFEGYETIATKYGSKQDDSPKTLIFTIDRATYGYEIKYSKSAGGRSIHVTIFIANKQYAFGASSHRQANRMQINASLATPIKHFQQISFGLLYDIEEDQSHNFQVVLSGRGFKYGILSEFSMKNKHNFQGAITFETLMKGYEKVVIKVQQIYSDIYWRFSLEQVFSDEPTILVILENSHQGTTGYGKMQLSTTFDNLKTADAFYKYEHAKDSQMEGQVGVTHNGRTLLDINTTTNKDGGRVVEIVNPIQPVSVQYTYSVTKETYPGAERTISVEAVANWLKSNRQVESSIGFNARVITKPGVQQIVVHSIHPVLPITLIFVQEINAQTFLQRGEISWDKTDFSSMSYEVRTLRMAKADGGRLHNVTTRLSLPIRTFELSAQNEHTPKGNTSTTRTAAFVKWDALRDESKQVGLAIEHGRINSNEEVGYRADVAIQHPKLEKDLTVRGEISTNYRANVVFLGRLELDYSRNERQKLVLEAKVMRSPIAESDDRYSVQLNVAHPVSNTHIRLESDVANGSQEMSGGFKLSYMDCNGQRRHLELRSKIVKLQKKIQFMMESNAAKLQMSAQLKALESGYLLSATSELNDQSPISAKLQFIKNEGKMADFTIVYDPNHSVKIRAGLLDPKTILMEKYQLNGANRIQDMKFLMRLNDTREVVTTFKWQPGSLRQLEDDLMNVHKRACAQTTQWAKDLSAFAAEESAAKYQILATSMDNSLSAAVTELKSELIVLAKDTMHMQKTIHLMYEKNTFYLRDIIDGIVNFAPFRRLCYVLVSIPEDLVNTLRNSAESIFIGFSRLGDLCRATCHAVGQTIRERIQDLPYAILHYSSEVNAFSARAINNAIAGGLHIGREIIFYCVPQLRQWQNHAPQWISRISNEATAKLQEYMDNFFKNHYCQALQSTLKSFVSEVQQAFNFEYWNNMWNNYSTVLERIADYALAHLDHPYLSAFTIASENAYNLGVWGYNFLKVEDRARDMLNLLMARVEDILMYVVQETIVPDYELPNIANHIVFDPENGSLEITQKLPVAWHSFTEAPKIYDSPEYHQMIQASSKLGQLPYTSVKNLVHAVKSEFTWNNMVPTFRGRAMLIGNQHYVTFDGRFYEFAGDCSYLLAHDFMDNNFTAVVMYNDNTTANTNTTTFLLILDGRRITVDSDLRVTVDGHPTQLPTVVGATRITMSAAAGTGNDQVVTMANDERQVWMSYGRQHRTLLLEVGGFYHGKTAGLFGSYDHEPFDDFRTPDKRTPASVEEFASSWEVGSGDCPSKTNRAHKASTNTFAVQKSCNDLFTGYSTMTLCTRKINPQPYRNMCVNDVAAGLDPCGAASAYVTMCRASGYEVTIPEKCQQ